MAWRWQFAECCEPPPERRAGTSQIVTKVKKNSEFCPLVIDQLFPIRACSLKWAMFTAPAAHISDTRKSCFVKSEKRKKKKNDQREGGKKRSSTLAFLEVVWDIAREISSDITRFYDRELPCETVRAWCSPAWASPRSCSYVHICVISKFTGTLMVICEGRAILAPGLTRLAFCGCQLNGDRWGHRQNCNPESRSKQSDDFKWASLPRRTQASCLYCKAFFLWLLLPRASIAEFCNEYRRLVAITG